MPDISFYILTSESQQERIQFACKLIEKAYRSGQFSFVLTDSDTYSKRMDDALWTFRAGSFVPHEVLIEQQPPQLQQTVLIGHQNIPAAWQALVLNLSSQMPPSFQNSARILEILDNSEACKLPGRERYKHYQQAGFNITTHNMNNNK